MAKAKSRYTEGDKFHLTCEATGKPIPTVTWYKDKDVYRGRRSHETITPGHDHYNISFIGVDTKDKGNYTCIVKNSHGSLAHSYVFDVKEEKTSDALVPGIVSACVLITLATLAVICWCRQSRTKKFINYPVSKVEFEYDAFIIFSSQDSDWVIKTLIPTLEEKHLFKCCVHYRDFVPGVPFRENMLNSVYKSRVTIAVVSINFFNSNYCGSEMDFALRRLEERRDDSLVVIKLDDVDRRKLPNELRKRSYIDYQKDVEKEHWERKLVNFLKNPNNLYKETIL